MNIAVNLLFSIAAGLGAYLLVCAWVAHRYTRAPKSQAPRSARREISPDEVNFASRDGRARICGWYLPAGQPMAAAVLVLGQDGCWGADLSSGSRTAHLRTLALAKSLRDKGISVLMIHLRDHGRSSAARTGFGELERHDVLGAVDYLLERGYLAGRIGVIGASVGASAALMAAAVEPAIGAVVADSPGADFAATVRHQWRHWPVATALVLPLAEVIGRKFAQSSLRRLGAIDGLCALKNRAVLIVHGQGDRLVAPVLSQETALACGARLWLTASRAHASTFREAPPLYITRVVDFFCQHLPPQRAVCVIWPKTVRAAPAPAWERLAA